MAKNKKTEPSKSETVPGLKSHAEGVLLRLVKLADLRKAARSRRENLFTERDSIEQTIEEYEDQESPECVADKARAHDVTAEINRLRIDIKFYADTMESVIANAAQAQFQFMESDDDLTPPAALYQRKKKEQPKLDYEGDEADGREREEPKNDAPPDGVDQHLAAAVIEIGVPEDVAASLVKAGFGTVKDLANLADSCESMAALTQELQARVGRGQEIAKKVAKQLAAYRKKHRQASLERDREENN